MSTSPSGSSQPAPPNVAPVEHNGIRYVQDSFDGRQGDQLGGYLAAIDADTGQRLWRLKVYNVPGHDPAAPGPVSIHFRSMRLAGGETLQIEDEVGRVFHVNLASRGVTQISGPQETAPKPAANPRPKPKPEPE